MKFWWPQCETIIASAYAYKLTGDAKYMKWHKLASEWAWKHLKDRKYPEWYGYLHRDGTTSTVTERWRSPRRATSSRARSTSRACSSRRGRLFGASSW